MCVPSRVQERSKTLAFPSMSVQGLPAAAAPWATLSWAQYYVQCLRCEAPIDAVVLYKSWKKKKAFPHDTSETIPRES